MTEDQLKKLCKLYNISVRKRWYIFLQGYVASAKLVRDIWNAPSYFFIPCGWNLNTTQDSKTSEYSYGYISEEVAKKDLALLEKVLKDYDCTDPVPMLSILPGWQVLYQGRSIGTKFDFGNGGKKGLYFPSEFYSEQSIFYTQQQVVSVLEKLLLYIVDHLHKKKEWSSIKDHDGSILKQTTDILNEKRSNN